MLHRTGFVSGGSRQQGIPRNTVGGQRRGASGGGHPGCGGACSPRRLGWSSRWQCSPGGLQLSGHGDQGALTASSPSLPPAWRVEGVRPHHAGLLRPATRHGWQYAAFVMTQCESGRWWQDNSRTYRHQQRSARPIRCTCAAAAAARTAAHSVPSLTTEQRMDALTCPGLCTAAVQDGRAAAGGGGCAWIQLRGGGLRVHHRHLWRDLPPHHPHQVLPRRPHHPVSRRRRKNYCHRLQFFPCAASLTPVIVMPVLHFHLNGQLLSLVPKAAHCWHAVVHRPISKQLE